MKSLIAINAGLYLSTCPTCAFMPFSAFIENFFRLFQRLGYWFFYKKNEVPLSMAFMA